MLAGAVLLACLSSPAAARSTATITLSEGDGLSIAGSKIQCGVSANVGYGLRLSGTTYIVCGPSTQVKYVDGKGDLRPNSYSFGISDAVVSSLKWDAAKRVHVLDTWPEG